MSASNETLASRRLNIKPKIQKRHLFADLVIDHLCWSVSVSSLFKGTVHVLSRVAGVHPTSLTVD